MAKVASKSAITPPFKGETVIMDGGVFPSIFLASVPIDIIFFVFLCIATTEGSLITIPLPLTKTRVFAVPKSIPISYEKRLKSLSNINIQITNSKHQILNKLQFYKFQYPKTV